MARERRVVAVSGSASGMGKAVCGHFQRTGSRVIGIDIREAEVIADLRLPTGRKAASESVIEAAGGRLDTVVACAGLGPHVRPESDIVRVNYFGAVNLLDDLLPTLQRGEAPAAVVIASNSASLTPRDDALLAALERDDEEESASLAETAGGIAAYGMSKLALVRAIRHRARAWGNAGVRINSVAPGPIDTPMLEGIVANEALRNVIDALPIPLSRRGTVTEVAATIAFLADPANGYIHGVTLFVDGGSDAEIRPEAI